MPRKGNPRERKLPDLHPGEVYAVEINEGCLDGRFTATLIALIGEGESDTTLAFSNGVIMTGLQCCRFFVPEDE